MTLNSSTIEILEKKYKYKLENLEETLGEIRTFHDKLNIIIHGRDFWQVSDDEFAFLYLAVSISKPKIVFETGVGPGTSTSAILKSLPKGSKLISFDLGVKYGNAEEMPVGFVIPEELKSIWNLVLGDSNVTLRRELEKYKNIDMFFHDSTHTYDHVSFELNTVFPYLSKNFMIIVDNYDWTDAPKDFANKNNLHLHHVSDDMCMIIN